MTVYNRYVRNDQGTYTRITEESPPQQQASQQQASQQQASQQQTSQQQTSQQQTSQQHMPNQEYHVPPEPSFHGAKEKKGFSLRDSADGVTGFLRGFLDRAHLQDIDTGDMILLGLLFFLFKEDADEELLFALGLLLIL